MKVLTSYRNGKLTLYLKGELDHHEAKENMRKIDRLIDEYLPRDCAVDMSELSFMDSSGIAVVLKIYKRMGEMGGRAWLENPAKQPLRVLDASGIDRIIRINITEGVR